MKIRRSARIIVGLGGVLLVWYGLLTGVFDPGRFRKSDPSDDETLLRGRVTFDGGPVTAHVEIREAPLDDDSELELPFGRDPVAASVETSEEGRFQFVDVPAGRYEVRALGPEGTVARKWVEYDPEGVNPALVLGLETGVYVLVGRVDWMFPQHFDGYVIAFTRGETDDPAGSWTEAVRPDESGRFEIAGFREREICLAFVTPGESRSVRLGVTIPPTADSEPELVEFVVDPTRCDYAGRVVDGNGAPIDGAVVTMWSRSDDPAARATSRCATDPDGYFAAIWSHAERLRWTVTAEGYVTKTVNGGDWPEEPIVLSPSR